MDDQEFLYSMRAKIKRLTGKEVQVKINQTEESHLAVELSGPVPWVTLGSGVLKYPGFARIAVEYAVACIRQERNIEWLEFQVMLQRN